MRLGYYIFISCLVFIISGCVSIPDTNHMIVGKGDQVANIEKSDDCSSYLLSLRLDPMSNQTSAIDVDDFGLLTWNILKENREGWEKDFGLLGKEIDLFIIQEAYLTDSLKGMLRNEALNWIFAPAFTYRGVDTGVLTASVAPAEPICMERFFDPLTHLPKSILITRHPMSTPGRSVLVVNIHSINFAIGLSSFRKYWARLEDILSADKGPIILAGDFNTWSKERMVVVHETTRRLSLKPVIFTDDGRSTVFGDVVDHVYYRGLTPIDAEVYEVTSSDHNPMVVRFRLDDEENVSVSPSE